MSLPVSRPRAAGQGAQLRIRALLRPYKAAPLWGFFLGLFAVSIFLADVRAYAIDISVGSNLPAPRATARPPLSRSPGPSESPVPSPSPSASAEVGAPEQIDLKQQKQLLNEFLKAQDIEIKALVHQNKAELRELESSLKARRREWEQKEKAARHEYFNQDTTNGELKRAYVHDYLSRQKIFIQLQKDERDQKLRSQEVRLASVREDQARKLREFRDFLQHGERPPASLWP